MNLHYTPFVIPMLLAGMVSAALVVLGWSRRRFAFSGPFIVGAGGLTIWSLGYALELAAVEFSFKYFGTLIKYIGVIIVPSAFFACSLIYVGKKERLNPRLLIFLSIEPAVALALTWTNEYHGLMWTTIWEEPVGAFEVLVKRHGIFFWVNIFYCYTLVLLASYLLLQSTFRRAALYRGQTFAALIALVAPLVGNILYLCRLNFFHPFDLTPFSFLLTGIALAVAAFHYRFLDIVPVARNTILTNMKTGCIVLDTSDHVVELNPAAKKLAGGNTGESIGKPVSQVFSDWPNVFGQFSAAGLNGFFCPGPKGRYYDIQSTPLQNSRKETIGRVLVLHDVTERVWAEQELQKSYTELEKHVSERTSELRLMNQRLIEEVQERTRAQAVLQESEERYRQLVEQPFDGICVQHENVIVYINSTGVKLLGGERPEEIVGRSILDILHPDYRGPAQPGIDPTIPPGITPPTGEEKFIRLDGKEIDVEVSKTSLMYRGALSTLLIFRDITGRKIAEAEIRKAKDELEIRVQERTAALEKANRDLQREISERERMEEELWNAKEIAEAANRAKSEFLANMSHELRTPLNHILGFTQLVADKECGDLNETQVEYLTDVLQSSGHLMSLINDILDLSKVEAGKLDLELGQVSLRDILEGSPSIVQEKARKHRISFSLDFKGIPEFIIGDERKLKQVMYNLLSNALKFTPEGGRISIYAARRAGVNGGGKGPERIEGEIPSSDRDGDFVEIAVSDTGIGIQQENLESIFAPFEQVDSSVNRRFQGTGLGLTLTRRLVELHGGRIWAESEGLGKGSTFRFRIPVHPTEKEEKA